MPPENPPRRYARCPLYEGGNHTNHSVRLPSFVKRVARYASGEIFCAFPKNLRIYLSFILLFLTSCATTYQNSQSHFSFNNQEQYNAWLNAQQTWDASGRFAVKQGNNGTSGSFDWHQISSNHYQIHFYGPFGAGSAYLIVTPEQAIWKDSDGETRAETPDELVFVKTGYLFPVSYLNDWILGRPSTDTFYQQQENSNFTLNQLSQAGWIINYQAYLPISKGILPSKIEMHYNDIKIKLIISQWKVS